ncbi:hypothetical protein GE061_002289 [Apolygus lucorum]|uniref:Uncharacterized protein n=1 Tax=Apolygus lucorum TaxID=248454 RepID=A0A8S9X6I6_APOLU|nr:hypothetical protein GE061_002289 [Apolygus lucorum]
MGRVVSKLFFHCKAGIKNSSIKDGTRHDIDLRTKEIVYLTKMSTDSVKEPEEVTNHEGHSAEKEDSIPVLETIDINEMQPIVDKVVHVTKIYIPPKDAESSLTEPLAMANLDIPGTAHSEVTTPPDLIQTEAVTMPEPVVSAEHVEVQPQSPSSPPHLLPGVTADVCPENVGEIVPITIQPAYSAAQTVTGDQCTDNVVTPAFPPAYLPAPAPFLEEPVPTVQIKPDLVHYGTVVTGGSPTISEVHSSFAEPQYPTAHPLPTLSADTSNCDDGMSEISLPPVDPGPSSLVNDDRTTANGTANNVSIVIQPRNTSRKRCIIFAVALLVLIASPLAVFYFYFKDSPA